MSIPILRGTRLLFRVDPLPCESPRGYLCRVAEEHGYCGPFHWPKLPDYRGPAWSEMIAPSRLHTCYAWNRRSGRPCATGISADAIDSTSGHFMANGLVSMI